MVNFPLHSSFHPPCVSLIRSCATVLHRQALPSSVATIVAAVMLTNGTSVGAQRIAVDVIAVMADPTKRSPGRVESFGAMSFVVRGLKVADSVVGARGGEAMTDHVGRN